MPPHPTCALRQICVVACARPHIKQARTFRKRNPLRYQIAVRPARLRSGLRAAAITVSGSLSGMLHRPMPDGDRWTRGGGRTVDCVEVRELRMADGIVIGCQLSGDPGAPAMVLLHALGEQAATWDEVVARFATQFRVVALDLRGHGASTWPGTYSFTLMRGDVLGVLDALDLPDLLIERELVDEPEDGRHVVRLGRSDRPGRLLPRAGVGMPCRHRSERRSGSGRPRRQETARPPITSRSFTRWPVMSSARR